MPCPIWNIRYVEARDGETHVWLVDFDGVPSSHRETIPFDASPMAWVQWLGSFDPYYCTACDLLVSVLG
jgi:hypothetical protein